MLPLLTVEIYLSYLDLRAITEQCFKCCTILYEIVYTAIKCTPAFFENSAIEIYEQLLHLDGYAILSRAPV